MRQASLDPRVRHTGILAAQVLRVWALRAPRALQALRASPAPLAWAPLVKRALLVPGVRLEHPQVPLVRPARASQAPRGRAQQASPAPQDVPVRQVRPRAKRAPQALQVALWARPVPLDRRVRHTGTRVLQAELGLLVWVYRGLSEPQAVRAELALQVAPVLPPDLLDLPALRAPPRVRQGQLAPKAPHTDIQAPLALLAHPV